jgi:hypothetical protein
VRSFRTTFPRGGFLANQGILRDLLGTFLMNPPKRTIFGGTLADPAPVKTPSAIFAHGMISHAGGNLFCGSESESVEGTLWMGAGPDFWL